MLFVSSLSFMTFLGAAVAQQSQNLFAPTFPVVAYPLATGGPQTTYLVACTAGSDISTCNFNQPYTLVEGPSTVQFAITAGSAQAATVGCNLFGTTSMACSATGGAATEVDLTITASSTFTGDAAATHFRAISIVTGTAALMTYPTPTPSSTSTSISSTSSSSIISTSSSSSSSIISSSSSISSSFNATILSTSASQNSTASQTHAVTTSLIPFTTQPVEPTPTGYTAASSVAPAKQSASGLGNAGAHTGSNMGAVFAGVVAAAALVAGVM